MAHTTRPRFRQVLPVHMRKAEGRLPDRLPRSAHRALLNAAAIPDLLTAGERRTISVVIENLSTLTWPAAEVSNLYLANRWLDETGNVIIWVDGRVPLPKLPPRTPVALSLPITAPSVAGDVQLIIDVVEEGDSWFYLPQETPLPGRVKVVYEPPPPVDEVLAELSATRANVDQLRKYVSELHTHYETSTSWKVTRPLRAAKNGSASPCGLCDAPNLIAICSTAYRRDDTESGISYSSIGIPLQLLSEHDPPGQARGHAFRESGFHPSGQSPRTSFSGSCASGTIRHGRF